MLQKKYIGLALLLLAAATSFAQKAERDFIRKGNRFFNDSVYVNAEVNYRKALEVNPQSTVSMFNLGNTLAQQNKEQQQPPQPQKKDNEMSKENAEQLLNSVMQDEKDVQDKVKKQQVIQGGRLEKDW